MQPKELLLYGASVLACASIPFSARADEPKSLIESSPPPLYRPLTLGVEAGSTGLGGFLSWRFADHWGVRTGFDYFEASDNGVAIGSLHYDLKGRLMSEPLTFDIYPWAKHSFHISVGMMFNQNEVTGTATDSGRILFDRGNSLNLKVTQQPVNPYLSIGGNFFYFDHAHHWALGGELGVAYTGDAKVSLSWSGDSRRVLDAAWRHEQDRVQDWANQLMFYPVVKLQVSYAF
jgi:hypothetical protein